MTKITVEQYAAGVLGVAVIRHWYRDGTSTKIASNELREVLDMSDEFPWNLELDPQERELLDGVCRVVGGL